MFTSLARSLYLLWPFSHNVRIAGLNSFVGAAQAEPWHLYAIRNRFRRPHVCRACGWIYKELAREARIFETGCGSGINLLWLGQRGFANVCGADLSASAIGLGRSLAEQMGIPLELWRDDSLHPARMPDHVDCLLALNWLYHVEGATLDGFLELYLPCLAPGGKIAFDIVDESFNRRAKNRHHTDDWHLPPGQRRESEYKFRLAPAAVMEAADRHGLRLLHWARAGGQVPRTVWFVEKKT